jgi:hypothetical protein
MKGNKILIIVLSTLLFSGCEDYLDRQPLDKISSSTFWQTKSDFDMALTAIYGLNTTGASWDSPPGGVWAYHLANWDNLTDNSYGQHNYFSSKSIVSGEISPTTGGYVSLVYSMSYQAIARINIFLSQLSTYGGSDFSDADKQVAEGEVRFFRAFYYFQLYCVYGDVPLVTEPLTLENQEQPKVSSGKIYDQIISDLDYAIANLNAVSYYENTGHVTKSTAQALKARILIYEAYGSNGSPDNNLLSQVASLCQEIIPLYELSPEFADVFQDKGQSGNKEIIYAVNYLAPDNVPAYGADLIYGDWIIVSPLQSFVDAFQCTDGLPWGESPLTDTENPFNNRDPRLAKTVFVDHPDFGDGNVHYPTNSRPTGYGVMKFLCPENTPIGYSTLSQQNSVVLRLAEVLLMYAEAQNEVGGPDASVYEAINSIRERVGMPDLPEGLSKDEMRESIRYERRIEMAFEGLRYFDLKRWHIAGEVLNSVTDGLLEYHWEDRFYRWPLPQSEIDKNNGTLEQNPDYL